MSKREQHFREHWAEVYGEEPMDDPPTRENRVALFWAIIAVVATLLVVFSVDARAQDTFTVNEPTVINTIVCDTEEQMRALMDAWNDNGLGASIMVFRSYNRTPSPYGGPACGRMETSMTPLEVVATYDSLPNIQYPYFIIQVEYQGLTGYMMSMIPLEKPGETI